MRVESFPLEMRHICPKISLHWVLLGQLVNNKLEFELLHAKFYTLIFQTRHSKDALLSYPQPLPQPLPATPSGFMPKHLP